MKVTPIGRNTEFDFDSDKHRYRDVDGRLIHGVTKICEMAGEPGWRIPWSAKMCAEVAEYQLKNATWKNDKGKTVKIDELLIPDIVRAVRKAPQGKGDVAIDFGHTVHGWLEKFVNYKMGRGKKPTLPENPAVKQSVKSFIEWTKENNPKFIGAEEVCYYENGEHDFAGTVDLRFELDGVPCIGDFKTAKDIRKREYVFQLGLYALAIEQALGPHIKKLYIFKLPKLEGGTWTNFEVKSFPWTESLKIACQEINHLKHLSVDIDRWLKQ